MRVVQLCPLIEILAQGKNLRPLLRLFIFQYFQVTYRLEEKSHYDSKRKQSARCSSFFLCRLLLFFLNLFLSSSTSNK